MTFFFFKVVNSVINFQKYKSYSHTLFTNAQNRNSYSYFLQGYKTLTIKNFYPNLSRQTLYSQQSPDLQKSIPKTLVCLFMNQITWKHFYYTFMWKSFLLTFCEPSMPKDLQASNSAWLCCQGTICTCCRQLHYLFWRKQAVLSLNRWVVVRRLLHENALAPTGSLQRQKDR